MFIIGVITDVATEGWFHLATESELWFEEQERVTLNGHRKSDSVTYNFIVSVFSLFALLNFLSESQKK